jgi:hypothetical protein
VWLIGDPGTFFFPVMTAFHAEVELGSTCHDEPERAGPMMSHLSSSMIASITSHHSAKNNKTLQPQELHNQCVAHHPTHSPVIRTLVLPEDGEQIVGEVLWHTEVRRQLRGCLAESLVKKVQGHLIL